MMENPKSNSVKYVNIEKVNGDTISQFSDALSVEEPLEIRLVYGTKEKRIEKKLSVTMRTPGNDKELAIGFLFTEGIITSYKEISKTFHLPADANVIIVEFNEGAAPKLTQSDRNFYTTSSCGVCGKSSIDAVRTVSPYADLQKENMSLSTELICSLPEKLRAAQNDFSNTGGIHASGLFSLSGELLILKEDVGRHNALDKLIGEAFINNSLPLNQQVLLLSGRASFELIQKAAMAGILVVAAIGAPSSLAVELAVENDITLVGFLRDKKFNIYNSVNRILIPSPHEDQD